MMWVMVEADKRLLSYCLFSYGEFDNLAVTIEASYLGATPSFFD